MMSADQAVSPAPGGAGPPRPSAARLGLGATFVIVVALLAVIGLALQRRAGAGRDAAARTTAVAAGPPVKVVTVELSPRSRHLALLGEARPFASVTLYAKVSGYLRDVRVDRGDRVAAGTVLATIESPETDRAFAGAKAEYDNKAQVARRVAQLRAKNFVSAQEAEQADAEAAVARERLGAFEDQKAYETLRAPFAGTVTARFADPGALVQNAANSQTSALPVVTVSQTDRLRVMVYLDQADASAVRAGTPATISVDERPDWRVEARIARVSGELDAKSRKMLAEVDLDGRGGAIVPGGFVRVTLDVPQAALPQAPAEALIVRKGGTFVGVVGSDGMVRLRAVRVAANDGRSVTFASGVAVGDRLALNLGAGTGDSVRVQGMP
jgi:RND family efflux transporter MFP subunit